MCTHVRGDEKMRTVAASTAPLPTRNDHRLHYRCAKCVAEADAERSDDNLCLRVLLVYILVEVQGHPVPLHTNHVRLIVHVPPMEWAWGSEHRIWRDRPTASQPCALPVRGKDSWGKHWLYSREEINAIWMHSGSYLGQPSD